VLKMTTPIIFPHVEIDGVKYPRVTLEWFDITGDSSWANKYEFQDFCCSEVVTEGFVFDIFEQDDNVFVRTFASYIDEEGNPTFGDRSCFPVAVLKPKSQHMIEMAKIYLRART
jgi:hypothetical protein